MITLDTARVIVKALSTYEGKPDLDALVVHVEKNTIYDRYAALAVIEFMQDIQSHSDIAISEDTEFKDSIQAALLNELDIAKELHYNYAVAKALLDCIIKKEGAPNSEEVRKTLREIARFMDSMLKMQEKVFNIQQMQAFQERVLEVISRCSIEVKEQLLLELHEADL